MLCPVCSMLKVLKSSSFALFACSGLNVTKRLPSWSGIRTILYYRRWALGTIH